MAFIKVLGPVTQPICIQVSQNNIKHQPVFSAQALQLKDKSDWLRLAVARVH